MCGGALSESTATDPWLRRLRCRTGHELAERGGALWGTVSGVAVRLVADPSDAVLRASLAAWLGEVPALDAQLHPSLREALAACAPDVAQRS